MSKQSIAFPDYNENLNKFVSNVEKGLSLLSTVRVTDNDSVVVANDTIQKALQLKGALDKAVETITRPAKDLKKEIDNWQNLVKSRAAEIYKPLEEPVENVKRQLIEYNREQERIKQLSYQRQQRINQLAELGVNYDYETECFKFGDTIYQKDIVSSEVDFLRVKKEVQKIIDDENKKTLDLFASQSEAKKEEPRLSTEVFNERILAIRQLGAVSRGQDMVLGTEVINMAIVSSLDSELFMAYYEKLQGIKSASMAAVAPVQVESPKVSGFTTRWTYEITDEASVPRQYCEVSSSLINKAIKEGIREIPGVRIFEEDSIKRTRR